MNTTKKELDPIIIFVGPSGVGKGTVEKILFQYPELKLAFSVSATTRKPREGEIDGVHYYFKTKKEFEKMIKENQLLEYDHHFENYYGTPLSEIKRIHGLSKIPFLEIETNGTKEILDDPQKRNAFRIITIFLMPPTIDDLKSRIINRNSETDKTMALRLAKAQDELKDANLFKYHVINDVPERAAKEIRDILMKEYGAK